MISGAAKDSEPHRVFRSGRCGSMNRDSPKSVSLMRGLGRSSARLIERFLKGFETSRMSVVSQLPIKVV